MKRLFALSFVLLLSQLISFSQTAYTFNGNGSWKLAANWLNNAIPPTILPAGDSIIIDHAERGECVLDASQTISPGAILVIRPGKTFKVSGNLSQVVRMDSTFKDSRDGQQYTFTHIGSQVWMTKNMNYAAPGSWCYDDNAANCATYGRLYDWNTALTVAPAGWHLPSDGEWTTLSDFLGGEFVAGGEMKATTLWNSPNTGATNSSGFAGLPGGYRSDENGGFYLIGSTGAFWSSTEFSGSAARGFILNYDNPGFFGGYDGKANATSVRCVRD